MKEPMISVETALARVLAAAKPVEVEEVALAQAFGRTHAAPISAGRTQPPFANSAMDGYALRASDAAAPGARLRVVGESAAGRAFEGEIGAGEAARIFTGAPIPSGADAVAIQEETQRDGDFVTLATAVAPGENVRTVGIDFRAGEPMLQAGRRLTPRDVALIAAANRPTAPVRRKPRVAILATGDEIAMPGEPIPPGGIVSSNLHALAALVRAGGGEPVVLPVAADTTAAIAAVADSVHGMDMLVTTGGASVGDHDLVISGLQTRGLVVDFWQIAMRPGKPLLFGRLGPVPVLGLPGNPVSAMVCAILFLQPALALMSGLPAAPPPTTRAILGSALRANDHRADHLRATIATDPDGTLVATPFPIQDSAMLRRLALADGLILRPPHAPALPQGAEVSLIRLDSIGL